MITGINKSFRAPAASQEVVTISILLCLSLALIGCNMNSVEDTVPDQGKIIFKGQVMDAEGAPLSEAEMDVGPYDENCERARPYGIIQTDTDEHGFFEQYSLFTIGTTVYCLEITVTPKGQTESHTLTKDVEAEFRPYLRDNDPGPDTLWVDIELRK